MIDSHCHLTDIQFEGEVDQIVNNFLSAGVEKVVTIGYDLKSSKKAIELSNEYDCVYCAVGVHPDDCNQFNEQEIDFLLTNRNNKLVAVGEIGLDYYHNKDNKTMQIEVFERQIKLAQKHKLPIVIHCRDAFGDTLEILKKYAPFEFGAVMHCYSGSLEYARELLKLGVKFSFTGTVTYKNAKNLQEVAKNLPSDSFFFETDCPYLTPTPFRGKRNEPKFVIETAKFVAELRNMSFDELVSITDKNASSFFKI